MNRTPQSKRFWRILGPILVYFGIQFVGQVIVQTVVLATHMQDLVGMMQSAQTEPYPEVVAALSVKMMEWMMEYQSLISGFLALCTIPLPVFLFWRDRKMERAVQLPVNKVAPLKKYIWILLFGVAFCVGMNVVMVMSGLAMKDVTFLNVSKALYSESMGLMLVCQGLIVPIAEEWMFRGVLYRRCREQMKFWGAAFSVSLFFAFVHGSVTQIAYTLILGIFLAYIYEKFGSLKAPIFLHILVNSISIVLTKKELLIWLCSDFMRMAVCVIGCAFIGAVAYVEIRKIDEKPEVSV